MKNYTVDIKALIIMMWPGVVGIIAAKLLLPMLFTSMVYFVILIYLLFLPLICLITIEKK